MRIAAVRSLGLTSGSSAMDSAAAMSLRRKSADSLAVGVAMGICVLFAWDCLIWDGELMLAFLCFYIYKPDGLGKFPLYHV